MGPCEPGHEDPSKYKWHRLAKALLNLDNLFPDEVIDYTTCRDIMLGSANRFMSSFGGSQIAQDGLATRDMTTGQLLVAGPSLQFDCGQT